jgi:hypothetical protein
MGQQRAFGREVVKSYTSISTIALSDPAVSQFWISLGDRYPMPHSQFVGFQIDFKNMKVNPLGTRQTSQYASEPDWDLSLDAFTRARTAYAQGNKQLAVDLIDSAIQSAAKNGLGDEPAYHFSKARVLTEMALDNKDISVRAQQLILAMAEYNQVLAHKEWLGTLQNISLWNIPGSDQKASLMEALTSMYSVATSDALREAQAKIKDANLLQQTTAAQLASEERNRRLQVAGDSLQAMYQASNKHFDLEPKLDFWKALGGNTKVSDLDWPDIDLVVVED